MNRKITALFIVIFMIISGCIITSAKDLKNNKIFFKETLKNNEIDQTEKIEVYGINAFTGSEDQKTETEPYGEHGIRISQSMGYGKARYSIYLECSDEGVENDVFQIGVLFRTMVKPGSVSILNINTNEYDLLEDSLGREEMKVFSTWWSLDLSFNDYVSVEDDNEIVTILFECDSDLSLTPGEDLVIDTVYVTYKDKQEIIQQHIPSSETEYSGNYNSIFESQTFIPDENFKKLTRVKLLFHPKHNTPSTQKSFSLSINAVYTNIKDGNEQREIITKCILKTVNFYEYNKATGPYKWIDVELNDVELLPKTNIPSDVTVKYYISIVKIISGDYAWCYSGGYNNENYYYKLYGSNNSSEFEENPSISPQSLNFVQGKKGYIQVDNNDGGSGSGFWWQARVKENHKDYIKINGKSDGVSGLMYRSALDVDTSTIIEIKVSDVSNLRRGENDLGSPIYIEYGDENGVVEKIDIPIKFTVSKYVKEIYEIRSIFSNSIEQLFQNYNFFENLLLILEESIL